MWRTYPNIHLALFLSYYVSQGDGPGLLPLNTVSSRFPKHNMMMRSSRSFEVIIGPCVASGITSLIPDNSPFITPRDSRDMAPTAWDGGATKCLPTRRYMNIFRDQLRHPTKVYYRNMSGKIAFTKFLEVKVCKKRLRGCQSGTADSRSRRTFRESICGAYMHSCGSPI